MSEESKESIVVLRLSDPKTWALLLAIVGGPAAVSKLSLSSVENQQQRVSENSVKAVEKTESIDDRLKDITIMVGEMRYRLEKVEDGVNDLQESKKGK